MRRTTTVHLVDSLRLSRLVELASNGTGRAELVATCAGEVVVDLEPCRADPGVLATLPLVVVGIGDHAGLGADLVDVVVPDPGAAAEAADAVRRWPKAATALAMLLRGASGRTVTDGLVAESATYSLLQAGPEHRSWLDSRPRRRPPSVDQTDPVRLERTGDELRVTLQRPDVHNALNAAMRDGLLDALAVASADPRVHLEIDGAGASFCSGGDLDEFGTLDDPASAHLLRLGRSVGYAIHDLADRVTVRVHGHCVGSGLELAAFAGRVMATEDATFALPELAMGLVPGAGGTVSITRRIGRHRTAWLALTGRRIDAREALRWGLVDELSEAPADRRSQNPRTDG